MVCILFSLDAIGQNLQPSILYSSNSVTIRAEQVRCESVENGTSKEYIILNIENQNYHAVELSFKKEMWYDGKCLSCDSESSEYVFTGRIEPSGTNKGECDMNNGLRIFSKMHDLKNARKLTHYELKQISVHEVN